MLRILVGFLFLSSESVLGHSLPGVPPPPPSSATAAPLDSPESTQKRIYTGPRGRNFSAGRHLNTAGLLKALCILSSVLTQLAPLPAVLKAGDSKILENPDSTVKGPLKERSAALFCYLSLFFSALQWCFYGLSAFAFTAKSGFLVLVYANLLGVFLGIFYIRTVAASTFFSQDFLLLKLVSGLSLIQLVSFHFLGPPTGLLCSGILASAFSVLLSATPLATLKTNPKNAPPASFLLVSTLSSLLWTACGFMLHDAWILIPNGIGLLIGSACVGAQEDNSADETLNTPKRIEISSEAAEAFSETSYGLPYEGHLERRRRFRSSLPTIGEEAGDAGDGGTGGT